MSSLNNYTRASRDTNMTCVHTCPYLTSPWPPVRGLFLLLFPFVLCLSYDFTVPMEQNGPLNFPSRVIMQTEINQKTERIRLRRGTTRPSICIVKLSNFLLLTSLDITYIRNKTPFLQLFMWLSDVSNGYIYYTVKFQTVIYINLKSYIFISSQYLTSVRTVINP